MWSDQTCFIVGAEKYFVGAERPSAPVAETPVLYVGFLSTELEHLATVYTVSHPECRQQAGWKLLLIPEGRNLVEVICKECKTVFVMRKR